MWLYIMKISSRYHIFIYDVKSSSNRDSIGLFNMDYQVFLAESNNTLLGR